MTIYQLGQYYKQAHGTGLSKKNEESAAFFQPFKSKYANFYQIFFIIDTLTTLYLS